MKKNLFFVIVLCLVMTGCSATYDLYIGDKLTDNIFLYEDNSKLNSIDYYDMNADTEFNINNYSDSVDLFQNGFDYQREEYSNNSVSGYIYNYTNNYKSYDKKSMIYNCYDKINIYKNNNIFIETSDNFVCFDTYPLLDDVTVNIHYGGKLINTNADTYKDGIYTWYIRKSDINNKIYLEVEKTEENYTFDIIGGIIFGILLLVTIFVFWRYKKKTEY